jgi:two-component system, sensor histidine kinase and response regulator
LSTPTPLDARDLVAFDPGFHHVLGSMPGVAYVEAEGLNGITLYMSPRVEALTGHPPERFLDSRDFWFTLVHEEDRERVEAAEEAANTTSSYLEEYRLLTADDRVVWVRDEAVYVPATERRPGHWIGLIIDITREKEAETRAAEVESGTGR